MYSNLFVIYLHKRKTCTDVQLKWQWFRVMVCFLQDVCVHIAEIECLFIILLKILANVFFHRSMVKKQTSPLDSLQSCCSSCDLQRFHRRLHCSRQKSFRRQGPSGWAIWLRHCSNWALLHSQHPFLHWNSEVPWSSYSLTQLQKCLSLQRQKSAYHWFQLLSRRHRSPVS